MKIISCKVNHMENPIGFDFENIVLNWKVIESKGKQQKYFRAQIWKDVEKKKCVWDSGEKYENLNNVYVKDFMPEPRTRYYWGVSICSDIGKIAESEIQWFETGKMQEEWIGKWITCDSENSRHPVFIKNVNIEEKVKNARLYICGLGLYEAFADGEKIGEEFLTPYCNAYDRWIQYQTYDVTEKMKEGETKIEILLGNGWYKGRFGFEDNAGKGWYGDSCKVIAELHLEYADGRKEVIGTDNTWEVKRSNLLFSNIYDGEWRDDTLEPSEVKSAEISIIPEGKLTARYSVPVKVHEVFEKPEIIKSPAGELILDMGQNFAGIFKLKVHEKRDTRIHLQFGEILQNGNFYNGNLRTAKAEYVYISDGKEKEITPHFTFYGYRFVKIEGIEDFKEDDFTGLALYSDMEETGFITTGNKLVDQLISNTRWGLKSNFVDVPTDCPQRDERMGWTGDAQVFSSTACYLTDSFAFYRKYLHDMWEEQIANNGKVPHVIPAFGQKKTSSVWGDAATIIPWTLYQFYGDKTILEEQFCSMRAWVDYMTDAEEKGGGWGRRFHYGDWLALDNYGANDQVMGATDEDYIAYVYYMRSAELTANAAGVLEKQEYAVKYRKLEKQLREKIRKVYFSEDGRCCINTQTALILALKYNLTDNREWTVHKLRSLFAKNHDKLQTGFVGTPLLGPVMSENGLDELAYTLLLNEEYPGWLYEVKMGATTIWERWNSVLEDGSISSTGMNSLNHYSYGAIVEWIFAYAGGIRKSEHSVGFNEAIIEPHPDKRLGKLKCVYNSPAGFYKCSWEYEPDGNIQVTVEVPFGCTALLYLPDADESIFNDKENEMFSHVKNGACILQSGRYSVAYKQKKKVYKTVESCMIDILGCPETKKVLFELLPELVTKEKTYCGESLRQVLLIRSGMAGIPVDEELEAMIEKLNGALLKAQEEQ